MSNLLHQNQFAELESYIMLGSVNIDATTAGMNIDVQTFTQVFNSRSMTGNHSMRELQS